MYLLAQVFKVVTGTEVHLPFIVDAFSKCFFSNVPHRRARPCPQGMGTCQVSTGLSGGSWHALGIRDRFEEVLRLKLKDER